MASTLSAISDLNHILVFNNKLLQFKMIYDSVSSTYTLNCNAYAVNLGEQRLKRDEKCVETVGLFRYKTMAAILDCKLITLGESQLQIPLVLIGKQYKDSNTLKLLLVTVIPTKNGRFSLSYYGVTIRISFATNLDAKLTDGPTIFWLKRQTLFVNYLLATNKRFVTMIIILPDFDMPSILTLKPSYDQISSTSLTGSLLLIVRTQSSTCMTTVQFKPYKNSISIASKTELKQSSHEKYLSRARTVSFVDDCRKERFLCSTSDCNLVEFDFNGSVTNIITSIGFVADRIIHYTGKSASDRYVIVQSQSKLSVIDLNRFEVINMYEDVTDVYVGDFVRFGSSIRLLLITLASKKDLDGCRIKMTDLNRDYFTSESTEGVRIEPSFVAVKKGLEARSIAGREAVSRNSSQLEHLAQVVNEVCETLRESSIGHEPKRKEQTTKLFSLLNRESDNEVESSSILGGQTLIQDECCEPLDIGRPWQRIVNDKWVIGLEIVNLFNGLIWDLHLILASKQHELTHSTNLFRMKQYSSKVAAIRSEPPCKKFKTHDREDLPLETENVLKNSERVFLTTSLDVGVLQHETQLSIDIAVTFKRKVHNVVRNGYVTCPSITLDVDTLLSNNFRTNFEEGKDNLDLLCDLAAAQATTEAVEVTLVSKSTDMNLLEEIIKQSCGFSYVRHLSVFYWNKTEKEVLSGAFLKIVRVENKSRAHSIMHSKNRSQFFALVQYLYGVMPEDILILPDSEDVPRSNVAFSLSQETKFIADFFEKEALTADEEEDRNALLPMQTEKDVLQAFEEQTSSNEDKKRIQTFEASNYAIFRRDLLKLETKTDKLFISELMTKKSS